MVNEFFTRIGLKLACVLINCLLFSVLLKKKVKLVYWKMIEIQLRKLMFTNDKTLVRESGMLVNKLIKPLKDEKLIPDLDCIMIRTFCPLLLGISAGYLKENGNSICQWIQKQNSPNRGKGYWRHGNSTCHFPPILFNFIFWAMLIEQEWIDVFPIDGRH